MGSLPQARMIAPPGFGSNPPLDAPESGRQQEFFWRIGPWEGTAGERPPPGWARTPAGAEGEQPVLPGVVTPL